MDSAPCALRSTASRRNIVPKHRLIPPAGARVRVIRTFSSAALRSVAFHQLRNPLPQPDRLPFGRSETSPQLRGKPAGREECRKLNAGQRTAILREFPLAPCRRDYQSPSGLFRRRCGVHITARRGIVRVRRDAFSHGPPYVSMPSESGRQRAGSRFLHAPLQNVGLHRRSSATTSVGISSVCGLDRKICCAVRRSAACVLWCRADKHDFPQFASGAQLRAAQRLADRPHRTVPPTGVNQASKAPRVELVLEHCRFGRGKTAATLPCQRGVGCFKE